MKPQHDIIKHSPEISSRRRALFPVDFNEQFTKDFSDIAPIQYGDSSDSDENAHPDLNKSVGDYDIIGVVDSASSASSQVNTPSNNKVIVPDITPTTTLQQPSPTQKLKTPHELFTSTNLTKLPRLTRKSIGDSFTDDNCDKNLKIRTALFPPDNHTMSDNTKSNLLSPKIFYSQSAEESSVSSQKRKTKPVSFLCGRKRGRRGFGQINAGVRHSIRRFKKNNKKLKLIKAVLNNDKENIVNLNNEIKDKENKIEDESFEDLHEEEIEEEIEPDPNKKFFKSQTRQKGVFSLNKNLKIKVDHGKVSVMENKKKNLKRTQNNNSSSSKIKRAKLDIESDFSKDETSEAPLIAPNEVTNIISTLEVENKKANVDILLSPTSVMCDMASGLAINSPKKAKNLNKVLDEMPNNENNSKRLFPIFYPGQTQAAQTKALNSPSQNSAKKFKALDKSQMLLDAGQKKFGAVQCPTCEIIYHQGDPNDEQMHQWFHNSEQVFKFQGWKNERVIMDDFIEGKIIKIIPADSKLWWKRVHEVLEVINQELGFFDLQQSTANSQVFFYIKNRRIVGVLVAELKHKAHKLLTPPEADVDLCSEESYPVKCGVSRIWVSPNWRKKGVASTLMNAMRKNFMFGYILRNDEIALSSPTQAGKYFGCGYFKTENFLIYTQ